MKARDSLLVALPAVLAGVGLGYLFAPAGGGARGRSEASVRAAVADAAVAQEPRPPLAAPGPEPARVVAEPVTAEATPRVAAAELERALDAVGAPSLPASAGTGGIRGRVTDEAGAPLAGVAVIADVFRIDSTRQAADVGAGPPPEQELEEFLREQARSWAEARAGRQRAVSGAGGTFELTNLDPVKTYSLSAFLAGFVVESDDAAYAVMPGSNVRFRARRVHVIPIELVSESGALASEGVVGVTRGDREQFFAWSADEPELRISAGLVGLRGYAGVRQSGFGRQGVDSDAASEEVSLDVVANGEAPVRLVLTPRSGIRGLVIDEFGGQGGRSVVRLLPIPAGSELDERALASSARQSWQLGNRFEFLDLSPGTYAVGLSNWEEALLTYAITTVSEGVTEVDLIVPEPDPESHLVVRAFGPGGTPLEDLEFRWMHRQDGGSRSGSIRGRRAPDGAYWLLPKAEFFGEWPSGTSFRLTIEHAQLGARELELEEGQREVTVTFEEPVSLVVVVGGYLGSGYESRVEVSLARKEEGGPPQGLRGRGSFGGREGLSPEGVVRYDNLAPGTWEVGLNIRSGDHRSSPVHSREVRALSGEVRVEISLPELYELTVLAPELPVGTRVALMQDRDPEHGGGFPASSDARLEDDQRASFDGLVAGRYRLWANGAEPMEVEVPSAEVVLEARRED